MQARQYNGKCIATVGKFHSKDSARSSAHGSKQKLRPSSCFGVRCVGFDGVIKSARQEMSKSGCEDGNRLVKINNQFLTTINLMP